MTKKTATPSTVEECDRELVQYRRALTLVTPGGRVAVWEQIDRILDIRFKLEKGSGAAASTIPRIGKRHSRPR